MSETDRMNSPHATHETLEQKVIAEIRRLLAIAVYLTLFFLVIKLYTKLILSEYHINYFDYGLTVVKALVLAKIILTAEALRLGERFRDKPLILVTLYNTVIFCGFALACEVMEHFIIELVFFQHSLAEAYAEIRDKGWPYVAGMVLVVFVAFIPFFAFRETERVIGEGTLRDLFFTRKKRPTSIILGEPAE